MNPNPMVTADVPSGSMSVRSNQRDMVPLPPVMTEDAITPMRTAITEAMTAKRRLFPIDAIGVPTTGSSRKRPA